MCSMVCLYKKCRKVPLNYILLGTYTLSHSYMIAAITCLYKQDIVIAAAICTLGMFVALTCYACFTKTDITKMGGFLSSATMMIMLGIILFSFFANKVGYLIICCVMVALLSIWIVHDTQLIIGGKHRAAELGLDDYCLGALMIYSDIVTAFIYILQILNLS